MSEQENVKIALNGFDAINARDLDRLEATWADDYKFEGPGAAGMLDGPQSRMYIQGFLTAFPDLHFDVTNTIAQGDYVVVNWVGTGTHTGPLVTPTGSTIPPTYKWAKTPGSNTIQIKGGKVARNTTYWDMVTLLSQLGLMPPT